MAQFNPDRWLKTDSDGRIEIDMQAGPNTQFGCGARGCFGTLKMDP
jgi:cytochrome P450